MRLRRIIAYTAVGAAGTAVQYLILFTLVHLLLSGALVASCIGAVAGAVINYGMNYRFTFRSSERHTKTAPRFFIVAGCGVLANWAFMYLLVSISGVQYLVAQCFSTAMVLALTYWVNSLWSFKPRNKVY
jgi:putative flippase GtrA